MRLAKTILALTVSAQLCNGVDRPASNDAPTNVFYVSPSGDDAGALAGKMDKPYRNIATAKARGGLVYVLPGHYTNHTSLAAKEIDYFMLPGVKIDYVDQGLHALIDDSLYPEGIDVSIDGFADFANHGRELGEMLTPLLIQISNPLSQLDIRCRDILLGYSTNGSINLLNCSNVNITAQRMYGDTGIFWREGSGIHIRANEIRTPGSYAFWEDSSETNTVQDMFADVDYIEAGGEGGLYVSGKNPNSALWIKSKLMKFNGVTGLHQVGVSKFYASSQKFWLAGTNHGALFYIGNTGRFWVDGNKATSEGAPFLVTARGTADLTIQQYEEPAGRVVDPGFEFRDSRVFVHGGRMDIRGTCVRNFSGTNILENMRLDSSRGTNCPVVIAGPGLILQNCTLTAAHGVESITATNAQTVTIIGILTVNTTPSKNITFVGGRLMIDNIER